MAIWRRSEKPARCALKYRVHARVSVSACVRACVRECARECARACVGGRRGKECSVRACCACMRARACKNELGWDRGWGHPSWEGVFHQVMTLLGQFLQGRGYPYLRLGTPEYHRTVAPPCPHVPCPHVPCPHVPCPHVPRPHVPCPHLLADHVCVATVTALQSAPSPRGHGRQWPGHGRHWPGHGRHWPWHDKVGAVGGTARGKARQGKARQHTAHTSGTRHTT
jgi:hypothetical protein